MTNPTTNFGWVMPSPTDLVTDLPADFEVFGQAVDTDFVDLLGGANGYILSKASATDLDFAWIPNDQGDITAVNVTAPITGGGTAGAVTIGVSAASTSASGVVQLSDSTSTTSSVLASTPTATKSAYDLANTANTTANAAIAKSTLTTAGDVIYRNATVPVRLGIGTAGQVLTVNSGATAPEWTTLATGGALSLVKSQTIGTAVSSVTVTAAFSATYDNYLITVSGGVSDQDNFANLTLGSTATGYYRYTVGGKYDSATVYGAAAQNATSIAETIYGSTSGVAGAFELLSPNLAKRTTFFTKSASNSTARYAITNNGYLNDATQYTAFTLTVNTGSFTGGTIRVYGYQNS